jgi:hypothetical protein
MGVKELVGKNYRMLSISCPGFMQLRSSVGCSFYTIKESFTGTTAGAVGSS